MDGVVYAKTVFGVDELQQRQMRLHPRLRTLLVMVDGKQTAGELIRTLAAAGVTQEHLQQLQDAGLIQPTQPAPAPKPVVPKSAGAAAADLLTVVPDPAPTPYSWPAALTPMLLFSQPADAATQLLGRAAEAPALVEITTLPASSSSWPPRATKYPSELTSNLPLMLMLPAVTWPRFALMADSEPTFHVAR